MRSIFHHILERYLATDQHAFDAYSHELWPEPSDERQSPRTAAREAQQPVGRQRVYDALEPQS